MQSFNEIINESMNIFMHDLTYIRFVGIFVVPILVVLLYHLNNTLQGKGGSKKLFGCLVAQDYFGRLG